MAQRTVLYCLILCLALLCGCASLTPSAPPAPGPSSPVCLPLPPMAAVVQQPAARPSAAEAAAAGEDANISEPFDNEPLEQFEEEPLVSEELPEANPDEVLSSQSEASERIRQQARRLEEEIKEEVSFDIPIILNERVSYFLDYFQTAVHDRFASWLARSTSYLPQMQEVFRQQGLPEDLVYLALIESGFNPRAVSRSGAVGPWQFIRATGHRYGLKQDWWVDERRDPLKATYAAAAYLTDLYSEFGSWYLAAAAYNCGEGCIRRAIRRSNTDDYWEICDHQAVSRETQDYVPKMIAAILIAKEPAKYGFGDLCYETPSECDTVEVDRPLDLNLLAELCGTDYQALKDLNPELRRNWTPPAPVSPYPLRVPGGAGEQVMARLAEVKDSPSGFLGHTVEAGETLYSLSRRHGCSVRALAVANTLRPTDRLTEGQKLVIPVSVAELESEARRQGVSAAPKFHTVRRGDNLGRLARRYKVSLATLKALNPGLRKRGLRTGQRLVVGKRRVLAKAEGAGPEERPQVSATHTVRRGDTLAKIARLKGLSLTALRDLNPELGNNLRPGQKVVIKQAGQVESARGSSEERRSVKARTYQVKPGDSLWGIARRYNVDVKELRAWNGLRKGESIRPGDRLKLLAGGVGG